MNVEIAPGLKLTLIEFGRIELMHAMRAMFGDNPPSTTVLAALAEHVRAVRIPSGVQLSPDGRLHGIVYLFATGKARASRRGRSWGEFAAPASLGLLPALAGDMEGIECTVVEEATAFVMQAGGLLGVLEDSPEMTLNMLRRFATNALEIRRRLPSAGFPSEINEGVSCPVEPLDLVERILRLRSTFGLGDAFVAELAQLARAAEEIRASVGTRLWAVGDAADHAVIVLCGALRCVSAEGEVFRFGAGDIVGNLDTMARAPRWFEATVADDIVALVIQRESMLDVLEDQPALGFGFMRMIARLLVDLRERAHD